ncbi:MAG: TadG family pilus assembly protein [Gammaproteobacteria bacterium]
MTAKRFFSILNNQQGIVVVIIAVCLVMLLGFLALSIDTSHLVVARNELQNAADAGALAGAAELYNDNGKSVNINANQIGFDASVANFSDQSSVEVNWTGGNVGDVQRGHWSFGLGSLPHGFTPNDSTAPVALWGVSTVELDENPNFINAVRVRTRRQNIPIASWFARIFGYDSFEGFAEAVAYIGFAGTLKDATADAPIAICLQAILKCTEDDPPKCTYECNEGRFINDAAGKEDEETGMWTNLEQNVVDGVDMCSSGTNASEVKPLVQCASIMGGNGVNPHSLELGKNMIVNNGEIQVAFNSFYNCWKDNYEDGYMQLTLPIIDCESDPTTCAPLAGAVVVTVVHMTQNPGYKDLPVTKPAIDGSPDPQMEIGWDRMAADSDCASQEDPDKCVWKNFVDTYGLVGAKINPETGDYSAEYHAKSIYFLKSCEPHVPIGVTGGQNFGILAEIPVLVH